MKAFSKLPALAAASLVYALSAHGFAYCLTHTCDPKKEKCQYEPAGDPSGCNVGGAPLYWASSVVTWDVQRDDSLNEDITHQELEKVVTDAFQRWVDAAHCGGPTASISLVNLGPVDCAKPEYNQTQPNANVITFHDKVWPYSEAGGALDTNTLALTTVFFNPTTGEIYDANVEINSSRPGFVLKNARLGQYDLNAVLTHELGHFLGLSHTSGDHPEATMFSSYAPGMTTLESDDIAAICASLPPTRMTVDSSLPRHGFSGECGKPDSGCCASTIGGRAPLGQGLGLWAFALGWCAWRVRLRHRARKTRSVRATRR